MIVLIWLWLATWLLAQKVTLNSFQRLQTAWMQNRPKNRIILDCRNPCPTRLYGLFFGCLEVNSRGYGSIDGCNPCASHMHLKTFTRKPTSVMSHCNIICIYIHSLHIRRKFRSQTSDNMVRWKSRGGKSQRREQQKKEDRRGERVRRKKMQAREPAEKSRFTVWFQWFVAPEGRKVSSLKRRVRSHLARWEISKSKRAKYTVLGPLLEVEMLKKCMPLWRISKSKRAKHTSFGALLEVEMPKKITPLWREAHVEVKSVKN